MLLKDIDKKLDMECELVFNKDDRVFSLSKASNLTFQGFLEVSEKGKSLRVHIPAVNSDQINKSASFVASSQESEGAIMTNVPIEDSIFELLSSLDKVKSTSTFSISVEKGFLTVRFRFHHNFSSQLSQVFGHYDTLSHLVKEIKIMPSRGITYSLNTTNEQTPLYVMAYEVPLSIITNEGALSVLNGGGVAELSSNVSQVANHRIIFYGNDKSEHKLEALDQDSCIYDKPMEAEPLFSLANMFNSQGLKRYQVFYRAVGDQLRIYSVVDKKDAIRHISESFRLFSRLKIDINMVLSTDYSPELWGVI